MLTYQEAVRGPDKLKWEEAIRKEKKLLQSNSTWKLVDRDEVRNKKLLSTKWIFKIKDYEIYKARLVVQGCEQRQDIDYIDTYSPVMDSAFLRILFALIANCKYQYLKFDIKAAFLYRDLKQEIYMQPLEGFEFGNKVCKLKMLCMG